MKVITKDEWDRVPKDNKKIYDVTTYMIYRDLDGSTCFGPVKVIEKNKTMKGKKANTQEEELWNEIVKWMEELWVQKLCMMEVW